VTAYLAVMLAAGATAREAAVIANFAAGVEVGKLGAQSVSAEELLAAYDEHVSGTTAAPVGAGEPMLGA
jgi:D-beta-D-heptose 7-phosphate kinase/D-beta-D-heptose 1-phosphate adenosyltransferase